MGFSNSSPLLSAKNHYPLYFRTNPSEHFSNLGRVAIVKRFKWKRVSILQKNNDVFTGISNSLVDLLKSNNIDIVAYESFTDPNNPKNAIENLKVSIWRLASSAGIRSILLNDCVFWLRFIVLQRKDARIIFAFFYQVEHYPVFCEVGWNPSRTNTPRAAMIPTYSSLFTVPCAIL